MSTIDLIEELADSSIMSVHKTVRFDISNKPIMSNVSDEKMGYEIHANLWAGNVLLFKHVVNVGIDEDYSKAKEIASYRLLQSAFEAGIKSKMT